MISDNVFVATVYINEVKAALDAGKLPGLNLTVWPWPSTPAPTCPVLPPQRTGRLPVPADVGSSTADPAVLRQDGRYGGSVHAGAGVGGPRSRLSVHLGGSQQGGKPRQTEARSGVPPQHLAAAVLGNGIEARLVALALLGVAVMTVGGCLPWGSRLMPLPCPTPCPASPPCSCKPRDV